MPKLTAYLDLERDLKNKVRAKFKPYIKAQSGAINARLALGDIAGAVLVAQNIDMANSYKGLNSYINQNAAMTVLLGASQLAPVKETSIAKSKKLPEEAKKSVKLFKATIDQSTERIRKVAYKLIDDFEQNTKLDKSEKIEKIVTSIADITEKELNSAGNKDLDLATSLQSSRLSGMGYIIEAEVLGITTYRVSEQLDSRTCSVCSIMHGKQFTIQEGRQKLDKAVGTSDPAELKTLSPWPKQDAASVNSLAKMSNDELIASGFQTPPYHPLCRGQLVVSTSVQPLSSSQLQDVMPNDPVVIPDVLTTDIPVVVDPDATDLLNTALGNDVVDDIVDPLKIRVVSEDSRAELIKDLGSAPRKITDLGIENGLSPEHVAVVQSYTDELSAPLNRLIRNGEDFKPSLRFSTDLLEDSAVVLNEALHAMPKYNGDVLREVMSSRSVTEVAQRYQVGKTLKGADNGFLSTSYEVGSFQSNVIRPETIKVSIHIPDTTKGAKIADYGAWGDQEKEVLFPTDVDFKVKSFQTNSDNTQAWVVLEEL